MELEQRLNKILRNTHSPRGYRYDINCLEQIILEDLFNSGVCSCFYPINKYVFHMVPCTTEVLGESGFGSIYDPESSISCVFVFSLLSVHVVKIGLIFIFFLIKLFMQN